MSWLSAILVGLSLVVLGGCESESGIPDGDIWYDSSSGLTWENPPHGGNRKWSEAKSYCARLSLDGGGWRLPTINELRTLIRGCPATEPSGSCGVTDSCLNIHGSCWDDSCEGCASGEGPSGGDYWPSELDGATQHWSSSPVADSASPNGEAFVVRFYDGHLSFVGSTGSVISFRCVR